MGFPRQASTPRRFAQCQMLGVATERRQNERVKKEQLVMSDIGVLVYVVDDDVSVREGVASLVRSAGLEVKALASGQEFLALQRPEIPSCLVLDVQLPALSGLDVQQELVRSGANLPIIFLTGYGDIPMTVRAIQAGAADFLTKPFEKEELLSAIRRCFGRYHTLTRQTRAQLNGNL